MYLLVNTIELQGDFSQIMVPYRYCVDKEREGLSNKLKLEYKAKNEKKSETSHVLNRQ
jgi:hypothetical protein